MAPYPTTAEISAIFATLASPETAGRFFEHVADDVDWAIIGSTPMSGRYNSKRDFQQKTLAYLRDSVLTAPLRIELVHVVVGGGGGGGGESVQAAVELKAMEGTVCKNGLVYDMRYCWVVNFRLEDGKIDRVRAYLDTDLLNRAIEQNK